MNTKHLIYIEDDDILAQVTIRALKKRGFGVNHYASLDEAEEDSQRISFSHALLDMKLEDGVSLPIITDLRKKNGSIKVVMLTGYASIATAVQAIKLGACNYLSKPATIDQILQAFNEEEEESNTLNESTGDADNLEAASLRRMEWEIIQQALADNGGNISATARQLKMHRRTLQRKLAKRPVSE